jgi:hypothetical protein
MAYQDQYYHNVVSAETLRDGRSCVCSQKNNDKHDRVKNNIDDSIRRSACFWVNIIRRRPRCEDFGRGQLRHRLLEFEERARCVEIF